MPYRYAGIKLTGITGLQGKHAEGSAVIGCSGTSFASYDDEIIPAGFLRIAVNEAIRKMQNADFWVLSDTEIVVKYSALCPKGTTILAMRDAVRSIEKHCPENRIYTVDSMANPEQEYNNGYQFYSRGTVMIGAIEMARYMGVSRFFVFGLDCYRTRSDYYYDGRTPQHGSEHRLSDKEHLEESSIWVTPRLEKMISKLNDVRNVGLWNGVEVYCVNSPMSQQTAIEKISLDQFKKMISGNIENG